MSAYVEKLTGLNSEDRLSKEQLKHMDSANIRNVDYVFNNVKELFYQESAKSYENDYIDLLVRLKDGYNREDLVIYDGDDYVEDLDEETAKSILDLSKQELGVVTRIELLQVVLTGENSETGGTSIHNNETLLRFIEETDLKLNIIEDMDKLNKELSYCRINELKYKLKYELKDEPRKSLTTNKY